MSRAEKAISLTGFLFFVKLHVLYNVYSNELRQGLVITNNKYQSPVMYRCSLKAVLKQSLLFFCLNYLKEGRHQLL